MPADLEKALASLQLSDNNSGGVIENEPSPNSGDEDTHDEAESGADNADLEETEREKLQAKERDKVIIPIRSFRSDDRCMNA